MAQVTTSQRTADWHAERAQRLTGSMYAAALGFSPYCSRQQLWRELTGRANPKPPYEMAVQWGEDWEPEAIAQYEEDTGNLVMPCGFFAHDRYDWLGASPDGLIGKDGLLEVKCPPMADYVDVPPHYLAQVHGELNCADRKWCDFAIWRHPDKCAITGLPQWIVHRIERDAEIWKRMLDLLSIFWFGNVVGDVDPGRMKNKAEVIKGIFG